MARPNPLSISSLLISRPSSPVPPPPPSQPPPPQQPAPQQARTPPQPYEARELQPYEAHYAPAPPSAQPPAGYYYYSYPQPQPPPPQQGYAYAPEGYRSQGQKRKRDEEDDERERERERERGARGYPYSNTREEWQGDRDRQPEQQQQQQQQHQHQHQAYYPPHAYSHSQLYATPSAYAYPPPPASHYASSYPPPYTYGHSIPPPGSHPQHYPSSYGHPHAQQLVYPTASAPPPQTTSRSRSVTLSRSGSPSPIPPPTSHPPRPPSNIPSLPPSQLTPLASLTQPQHTYSPQVPLKQPHPRSPVVSLSPRNTFSFAPTGRERQREEAREVVVEKVPRLRWPSASEEGAEGGGAGDARFSPVAVKASPEMHATRRPEPSPPREPAQPPSPAPQPTPPRSPPIQESEPKPEEAPPVKAEDTDAHMDVVREDAPRVPEQPQVEEVQPAEEPVKAEEQKVEPETVKVEEAATPAPPVEVHHDDPVAEPQQEQAQEDAIPPPTIPLKDAPGVPMQAEPPLLVVAPSEEPHPEPEPKPEPIPEPEPGMAQSTSPAAPRAKPAGKPKPAHKPKAKPKSRPAAKSKLPASRAKGKPRPHAKEKEKEAEVEVEVDVVDADGDVDVEMDGVEEEGEKEKEKERQKDDRLYCVCLTPYDEERVMIGCDRCDNWYHPSCVGLDEETIELIDQFFCPACMEANPSLRTTHKQRCARCSAPARLPLSKYCSDACGQAHMLSKAAKLPSHVRARVREAVGGAKRPEGRVDGGTVAQRNGGEAAALARAEAMLGEVLEERARAEKRLERWERRERLVRGVIGRWEEEGGAAGGAGRCGFDERLLWGDEGEEEGEVEMEEGAGRCEEVKCERHKNWVGVQRDSAEKLKAVENKLLQQLTTRERNLRREMDALEAARRDAERAWRKTKHGVELEIGENGIKVEG